MKIVSQVSVTISRLRCIPPSRTSSVFQKLGLYSKTISDAVRLDVFLMALSYAINEDVIFVLAVMHLHRDSKYWKDRLK